MKLAALSITAAAIFLSGCTPMFVPNAVPAPMMERSGQIQILGSAGTNGVSGSLAISPLQGLTLMGSGSKSVSEKNDSQSDQESHGHEIVELALGGYLPKFDLGGKVMKVEGFIGMGKGSVKGNLEENALFSISKLRNIDARYSQSFVQVNVSVSENLKSARKNPDGTAAEGSTVELGSAFRLSRTSLKEFRQSDLVINQPLQENTFIQFGAFARLGGGRVRLEAQSGVLYPVMDNSQGPTYGWIYIAAGVQLLLGPISDE